MYIGDIWGPDRPENKDEDKLANEEELLNLIDETIKDIREVADCYYKISFQDILDDKFEDGEPKKQKELYDKLIEFCKSIQGEKESYLNRTNNNYSFSEKLKKNYLNELYSSLLDKANNVKELAFKELFKDIINEKLKSIYHFTLDYDEDDGIQEVDEDDRFYTWHMGKYRDLGSGRFDCCYGLRPVIYLKTNIKTSGYSIVENFTVSSRKKHPEAKIWELIPQRD